MTATLSQPSPPSSRDFDVYRRVKIDRESTREVARGTGLSQTRICQIIREVADWMADVTPGDDDEDERRKRKVIVAEQIASERVDFMYGEAVKAWRASQGETKMTRTGAGFRQRATIETRKTTPGDPRYLDAAVRTAIKGSKLPISTLRWDASDEGENDEELDCSPAVSESEVTTPAPAAVIDVTAVESVPSVATDEKEVIPNSLPISPVHFGLPSPDAPLELDGILDRPRREGPALTAKERKRRAKLAKQKLKEARKREACTS